MMTAMQIYVWEILHSTDLARNYAYHQLELHMMVLSHLGKTYWTADLQHNLFTEALKALEGGSTDAREAVHSTNHQHTSQSDSEIDKDPSDITHVDSGMLHSTLEDFLLSFNPFMGLPMQPDELR